MVEYTILLNPPFGTVTKLLELKVVPDTMAVDATDRTPFHITNCPAAMLFTAVSVSSTILALYFRLVMFVECFSTTAGLIVDLLKLVHPF